MPEAVQVLQEQLKSHESNFQKVNQAVEQVSARMRQLVEQRKQLVEQREQLRGAGGALTQALAALTEAAAKEQPESPDLKVVPKEGEPADADPQQA